MIADDEQLLDDAQPDTRDEYDRARQRLLQLKALVESDGWKLLCSIASEMIEARTIKTALPMRSLDSFFEHTQNSGELSGITLVMRTPDAVIEELESLCKNLQTILGDIHDSSE